MLRPNTANTPAIFHFVMIKPSHYDDDGYPIQWLRSAIPSNTLACLNALAEDAKRRQVLGAGVDIRLHTFDETNRRVKPRENSGRSGSTRCTRAACTRSRPRMVRASSPSSARRWLMFWTKVVEPSASDLSKIS